MMRRLLLTRPASDNMALTAELAEYGIQTISSPLLRIERVAYNKPAAKPEGILLTSRHAAYACADYHDLPFYIVGQQTAAAAAAQGCGDIRAVAPDMERLLPLLPPERGLLYLSGEHVRHDYQPRLIVYRAVAEESLTQEALSALQDGSLDGVVFYSPRSAAIFDGLAAGIDLSRLTAYCLSPAIAAECRGGWLHIAIAAEPQQEAMLQLLADAK